MLSKYSIGLKAIADELDLKVIHAASDYETKQISSMNVSRPGLQFTGFYDYFTPEDIQVMGKMEMAYLRTLDDSRRLATIEEFFSKNVSALIVCHRLPPDLDIVAYAKKYNTTVLATDLDTSSLVAQLIHSLRTYLAARLTIHGVLVEVHGEGVLIIGDSGIGKSETALELIKRGHRLVSDDAVELLRMGRNELVGRAPEMIRYMIELRGVGIIDVRRIFGAGAILESLNVDFVVNFEKYDHEKIYDRLGIDDDKVSFLGVKIPQVTVPVAPGRNLSIIIEVAAINNRLKRMGINTGKDLVENYDAYIDNGWTRW